MLPVAGCTISQACFFLRRDWRKRRHVPVHQIACAEVRNGIGHLRGRDQMLLGLAMTGETTRHFHFHGLIGHGHLVDASVTTAAGDAAIHVRAMVEIDVIGDAGHLSPRNRFRELCAITNGLEHGGICPNLRMTRHARFCGCDSCIRGRIDSRVAISTIDSQIRHMMLMTKRGRLIDKFVKSCCVRRSAAKLKYGKEKKRRE